MKTNFTFTHKSSINNSNYVTYATYDQGSIKIIKNIQKNLSSTEMLMDFLNDNLIPIILIVGGFGILVGVWIFLLRPFHAIVKKTIGTLVYSSPFHYVTIFFEYIMKPLGIHSNNQNIPKNMEGYKSLSQILDDILEVHRILRKKYPLNESKYLNDILKDRKLSNKYPLNESKYLNDILKDCKLSNKYPLNESKFLEETLIMRKFFE